MANYSHRDPGEVEKRAVRRRNALNMKKDGATYEQIAEALGYANKGHAYKDIQKSLAEVNKETTLAAEEYRALQNERLEIMFAAIWPRAVGMDPNTRGVDLRAAEMILKLMERQARLNGVDAPTKTEVTVSQGVDARIEELFSMLGVQSTNPEVIQGELESGEEEDEDE